MEKFFYPKSIVIIGLSGKANNKEIKGARSTHFRSVKGMTCEECRPGTQIL
jgi:hypothetical protein